MAKDWSSNEKFSPRYSARLTEQQVELTRYRVSSGANIYNVASYFGVSVERLKRLIANRG